jgi:hypothetical protein
LEKAKKMHRNGDLSPTCLAAFHYSFRDALKKITDAPDGYGGWSDVLVCMSVGFPVLKLMHLMPLSFCPLDLIAQFKRTDPHVDFITPLADRIAVLPSLHHHGLGAVTKIILTLKR